MEFELGKLSELEFYARFFRDGSPIDGPRLKRCMAQAYDWIDGMPELLTELRARGVSMHALSNYPEWYQLVDERLSLSQFMSLRFISCRTGLRKPAPEAFLHVCAQLELAPESCLLVDDRQRNCESARKLGLQSVHFDGSLPALRQALVAYGLL